MNETLQHVLEALESIDDRFYELDAVAFEAGGVVNDGEARQLERRFMIEFALRYAAVMRDSGEAYEALEYDFEIPKKFIWSRNPDMEIRETWQELNRRPDVDMNDYFTTVPDFLVHDGQTSMADQRLILEAKVNANTPKGEAMKDIFHTLVYANKYRFACNVLLLVNIDLQRWLDWLHAYHNSGYYLGSPRRRDTVFIVSKEDAAAVPTVSSLAKLLAS